jgi:hypothetical protein
MPFVSGSLAFGVRSNRSFANAPGYAVPDGFLSIEPFFSDRPAVILPTGVSRQNGTYKLFVAKEDTHDP